MLLFLLVVPFFICTVRGRVILLTAHPTEVRCVMQVGWEVILIFPHLAFEKEEPNS